MAGFQFVACWIRLGWSLALPECVLQERMRWVEGRGAPLIRPLATFSPLGGEGHDVGQRASRGLVVESG